ncbi:MAG: hypothetical protein II897_05820 [Clostridia bacterium]|nr:hypothetical protein [Clostridia bacterium]
MVDYCITLFLFSSIANSNATVFAALIAAIASGVVALISLLSSIIGWIITSHQNKKQYIRDFDVEMYKELLPALFSLASETNRAIDGDREGGWVGYNELFEKTEKLFLGFTPFIQSDIRKQVNSLFVACRKKNKEIIDSTMEELINQISKYTNKLIKRR